MRRRFQQTSEGVSMNITPQKQDKFTFGLWTVGNRGRDPFGDATRDTVAPTTIVKRLSELGAYGVNFHDNDLVPIDATPAEQDKIVRDFKAALNDYGMTVPMATVNLFFDPVFKDGAFTSNDPRVRLYAIQKTMRAMDLGAECGAKIFVLWGGREGAEVDAAKDAREAVKWCREGLNFLCEYSISQGYGYRFAMEAKPNEPRGDIYFPSTGAYLGFISTLDHPEMVGVNPEVGHENMAGLNFYHVVAQAIEAGKLFHIDLNDQKGPRFDQDLRFGSEGLKNLFFLVKLLEESGYDGPRHFDAHSYRSEDEEGVWDFAAGCMRTYLIFREKAKQFAADKEIQSLLSEIKSTDPNFEPVPLKFSKETAEKVKNLPLDRVELAKKRLPYEKLDQLVVDLLLGVR
jgi:xylose isomerase